MPIEPDKFYKYRSLASKEDVSRAIDIIKHHRIFFSSPVRFNDPFDCWPRFNIEGGAAARLSYYKRLISKNMAADNRATRRLKLKKFKKKDAWKDKNVLDNFRQRLFEEEISKVGVLSMSSVNNNQLLWSHYADSHKGICFEFNSSGNFFGRALKVNYQREYPTINLTLADSDENTDNTFLTKSLDWAYEKEWRIIDYDQGEGSYVFPKSDLTLIIFGSRIRPEIRSDILSIVSNKYPSLPCKDALISEERYEVIVPIDKSDTENQGSRFKPLADNASR